VNNDPPFSGQVVDHQEFHDGSVKRIKKTVRSVLKIEVGSLEAGLQHKGSF
jgi:hypothetical protein